jgi:hypothetical protein
MSAPVRHTIGCVFVCVDVYVCEVVRRTNLPSNLAACLSKWQCLNDGVSMFCKLFLRAHLELMLKTNNTLQSDWCRNQPVTTTCPTSHHTHTSHTTHTTLAPHSHRPQPYSAADLREFVAFARARVAPSFTPAAEVRAYTAHSTAQYTAAQHTAYSTAVCVIAAGGAAHAPCMMHSHSLRGDSSGVLAHLTM